MSKAKSKKVKKSHKNQKEALLVSLLRTRNFVATHAFVLLFAVGGLTIGFALLRARSYLNPIRDENRYSESTSKIKYSKIDQKILNRLKLSQNDTDVQVKQSLVPNRSNPFNE